MSALIGVERLPLTFAIVATDRSGFRMVRAMFFDRIEAERSARSMRREWGDMKQIEIVQTTILAATEHDAPSPVVKNACIDCGFSHTITSHEVGSQSNG